MKARNLEKQAKLVEMNGKSITTFMINEFFTDNANCTFHRKCH